jgi:WD40 repeat protein
MAVKNMKELKSYHMDFLGGAPSQDIQMTSDLSISADMQFDGKGCATSLSLAPNGKTLAVGARIFVESTNKWTSEVQLWHTDNWSTLPTVKLGEGVMDGGVGMAFSPDGTLLAAEPVGKVYVWRADDWLPVKKVDADRGLIALVALSPDGKTLASTARGNKVRLWEVDDRTALPTLTMADDGANAMQFSPDSKLLATGGNDEEVHVWRL